MKYSLLFVRIIFKSGIIVITLTKSNKVESKLSAINLCINETIGLYAVTKFFICVKIEFSKLNKAFSW